MLPGITSIPVGASSGGLSAVTLVNRGTFTSSSSGGTEYTFSSQAIGTASATRLVVVAVNGRSSAPAETLSSATIGGISATIHEQITGTRRLAAIISATVPTGTTANVVLTFSDTFSLVGITVIAIDGLNSTTPTDVAEDETVSANALSQTVSWSADGFVIAAATFDDPSGVTWAGVAERWDSNPDISLRMTGGDLFPTTDGSSETVSATSSGSPSDAAMAIAAFR